MGKENLDGCCGPVLHFKLQRLLQTGGEDRKWAREWINSHPGVLTMYRGETLDALYPDQSIPRPYVPKFGVKFPEKRSEPVEQSEQGDQTDPPDAA